MQQHGVVLDFSADPVGIHFLVAQIVFQTDALVSATISFDSQDADSDDVDMQETSAQFPASLMMEP